VGGVTGVVAVSSEVNHSLTVVETAPALTAVNPTSGPSAGGTKVTITGSGLTGVQTVDFGAHPATNVSVISDTSLNATSPPGTSTETGPVTVDLTVTTLGRGLERRLRDQRNLRDRLTIYNQAMADNGKTRERELPEPDVELVSVGTGVSLSGFKPVGRLLSGAYHAVATRLGSSPGSENTPAPQA
jgi:hypothetical protein